MCAIFGISFLNGCTLTDYETVGKLISRLFKNSQVRGRDAAGIAVASRSKIAILKRDLSADLFTSVVTFENAIKTYCDIATTSDLSPISIIGHCRAKTKGSERVYENNHPIRSGNIVGVHNGIVGNDDNLFRYWSTKHDYMKRSGTVDSEIIFSLLNMYITHHKVNVRTAITKTVKETTGSMACAFLDSSHPYSLYLFRNHSPTDVLLYKDKGVLIFASQRDHITPSVVGLGLGYPTVLKYDYGSMMHVDLFKNRFNVTDIPIRNSYKENILSLPGVQSASIPGCANMP